MPIRKSVIERGLRNKGFREKDGSHKFFRYWYEGKYTGCWTMVSHGSDFEIGDNIVGEMRKQLKLQSRQQVLELCQCTLSAAQYESILRQQHIIP